MPVRAERIDRTQITPEQTKDTAYTDKKTLKTRKQKKSTVTDTEVDNNPATTIPARPKQ
ncbi:hypothetical protein [Flavobacterium rhizosphaerae]|uniref:Uncharacterized protein n=1 Tax=Flavobacterium rhizosphaerae TaxID=3163298 RepID=A0ABW8YUJ9_9FLAO